MAAEQESAVLVHGAIVAVFQGNGMWPMFAFGFGAIFILTQLVHSRCMNKIDGHINFAFTKGMFLAASHVIDARFWLEIATSIHIKRRHNMVLTGLTEFFLRQTRLIESWH